MSEHILVVTQLIIGVIGAAVGLVVMIHGLRSSGRPSKAARVMGRVREIVRKEERIIERWDDTSG